MDKFNLNKEEAILVIIDIQERLSRVMDKEEEVIKNTNVLISMAKTMNMPIIVTEQYPKGLGETVVSISENLGDDKKFEKTTFSACNKEFLDFLNETERKKVIITGMETHVCVYQTVRDLLNAGFSVFVAADGVCSRTDVNYKNGLDMMNDMGAVISNTETILFDILKEAGTLQFKALSKLIK
ncbi:MAG: isochorismatase family protein [Firmicutes bacterium]|nr:isochorismatase family protein [Bacillota bacterium]